jgi:LmbE family N-acetylglucosaminyl deacetylase
MAEGGWRIRPAVPLRQAGARFGVAVAALGLFLAFPSLAAGQDRGASALGAALRGLGVSTRVLIIGAHPDDEDTQIIAWLSRGRHVETGYLSLTRGDGGQNAIGNELGEALGVLRTEELLAARRIDGARQYFTRAYDYGFSKNAQEAFTQWPHDSLLLDVMTVVRAFRPHVIISVFTGTTRDGHGQHQAAGILAREAYDWSADTARFPRSSTAGHGAWTVSKFYRGASFRRENGTLQINVGEFDPVLGRSYAELAAISRSQHRSQAFGTLQQLGVRLDYLQREATRVPAPEDPKAERSLFDGIDTTWRDSVARCAAAPSAPRSTPLRPHFWRRRDVQSPRSRAVDRGACANPAPPEGELPHGGDGAMRSGSGPRHHGAWRRGEAGPGSTEHRAGAGNRCHG